MYLPSALYLCTQDILDSFFVEGFAVTDAHSTLLDLVVSHEAQKRFSMSLRLADRAAVMLAGSRIALVLPQPTAHSSSSSELGREQ
mgnify:CR=1 FL=1